MSVENIIDNNDMENNENESAGSEIGSLAEIMKIRHGKERSYSESQVTSRQHQEIPISKFTQFKNKYEIT